MRRPAAGRRADLLLPGTDAMASYQVTVRYGRRFQRYHTFTVAADDAVDALRLAADEVPGEVRGEADLVELREAVDPDERAYLGEDEEGPP